LKLETKFSLVLISTRPNGSVEELEVIPEEWSTVVLTKEGSEVRPMLPSTLEVKLAAIQEACSMIALTTGRSEMYPSLACPLEVLMELEATHEASRQFEMHPLGVIHIHMCKHKPQC
jgi:hypothetical protein